MSDEKNGFDVGQAGEVSGPPTVASEELRYGFWLGKIWFGREAAMGIALLCFGMFLLSLGMMRFVNDYACLPASKEELSFERGVLLEVQRSVRFGDTFVINSVNGIKTHHTAFGAELVRFIGDEIIIGTTNGPFYCAAYVMQIERAGTIIQNGNVSIGNRKKGRWINFLLLVLVGLPASLALFGGYHLSKIKSSKLRDTLNKGVR